MKITLTHEEVTQALARAIEEKTNHTLGECSEEDCYFTGVDENDEEVSVVRVEFHCTSFLPRTHRSAQFAGAGGLGFVG